MKLVKSFGIKFIKLIALISLGFSGRYSNADVKTVDINAKDSNGRTALHRAAKANDAAAIPILLFSGADINAKDNVGKTPLHYAIQAGNSAAISVLLFIGADINAKDNAGLTPLHYAAQANNAAAIPVLLSSGVDINAKDNVGKTPLHYAIAIQTDNLATVTVLVDHNADENLQSTEGKNAVDYAIERGYIKLMAAFRNKNAKAATSGKTVLHGVAAIVHADAPGAITTLLSKGFEVNAKDNVGKTPLYYAIQAGNSAAISVLVSHGSDVKTVEINAKDSNGQTALHRAAKANDAAAIPALLSSGADINAKDNAGLTPLHYAAQANNAAAIPVLLSSGADINAKDNVGKTPLHYAIAIQTDNLATVTVLVDHNADENLQSTEGKNAVDYAIERGYIKLMAAFRNKNAKAATSGKTVLHGVAAIVHADAPGAITTLLSKGFEVNAKDNVGKTPLYYAIQAGNSAAISVLVSHGSDVKTVEINAKDSNGQTALHRAAKANDAAAIPALLSSGADINAKDNAGLTPLHYAAQANNAAAIPVLLSSGADINAKDNAGLTPLHYAAQANNAAAIPVLLSSGADINAKDNVGKTPLHYAIAIQTDNLATVTVLVDHNADENLQSTEGKNAVDYAIERGYIKLMAAFRNKNAKAATSGKTVLHGVAAIVHAGAPGAITTLLSKGFEVNAKDNVGKTPLHYAIKVGNRDSIMSLLAKGADITLQDNAGVAPLEMAIKSSNAAVTEMFSNKNLKNGDGATLLHVAAGWTSAKASEVVTFFLGKGFSVTDIDKNKCTPLHYAARTGTKEVITLLVAHNADIAVFDASNKGPFAYAIDGGNLEKMLAFATSSMLTTPGNTLLHLVAIANSAKDKLDEALKLLVGKESNVNAKNALGETPLYWAARAGKLDAVQALIGVKADVNAKDNNGKTPLAVCPTTNTQLIEFLKGKGGHVTL